jgi:hypothetical protein
MKRSVVLIGIVLALGLVASAWAADVTGKWTAETQSMRGPGVTTFDFKVDGSTLTGTVTTQFG